MEENCLIEIFRIELELLCLRVIARRITTQASLKR